MMDYALKAVPAPQAILQAWMPFKRLVGVTSVHTEADDAQARATVDVLLDHIADRVQEDLSDCAPQSRISDILSGKRSISKEIARRLASRFHVRADVFL